MLNKGLHNTLPVAGRGFHAQQIDPGIAFGNNSVYIRAEPVVCLLMATVTSDTNTVGDTCGPIFEATGRVNHAGLFLGANGTGTFVLEISGQQDSNNNDEWIVVTMTTKLEASADEVASLDAGVNPVYAWAHVPGAKKVRARKTAGLDGHTRVTVSANVGSMS